MKKHFLPTALILLLALGYAGAQTINRAIQLSQDTTGAFSVDTNLGVYFPGHLLSTRTGAITSAPTVAATVTATVAGTDTAGTITIGPAATTATITFGQAFVTVPSCVVTWRTAQSTPTTYTPATTSLAITQGSTANNKIDYFCPSQS